MTTATKKPAAAKKTTTRVRKPAKAVAAKATSPFQKALLSGASPYAIFTAPVIPTVNPMVDQKTYRKGR